MTLERKLIILQSLMLASRRLLDDLPDNPEDLKIKELTNHYQKIKELACQYGKCQKVTQEECDYIMNISVSQAISPYTSCSENLLSL